MAVDCADEVRARSRGPDAPIRVGLLAAKGGEPWRPKIGANQGYAALGVEGTYIHNDLKHARTRPLRVIYHAWFGTSALSQLNFRVDRREFAAGVVDLHLPVDAALCAVDVG